MKFIIFDIFYLSKMYHHHHNVKNCAKEIVNQLPESNLVVCYSPMQAGKTEVMHRIIELMKNPKIREKLLINPSRIYILIPISLIPLKRQLIEHIPDMENRILHLDDLQRIMYCRRLLSQLIFNSLFLLDECHFGLSSDSVISKFLGYLKKGNHNYVIGFSATPYEHIVAKYPIISLEPMEGYYGIDRMFELKRIRRAQNLTDPKAVETIFDKFKLRGRQGYCIIRLPSLFEDRFKVKININRYFYQRGIEVSYFTYDQSINHNLNVIIHRRPKGIKIIYLTDRLRSSEILNTKYVFMVHDSYHTHSTCSTAQSLLGRCCGYDKEKDGVIVFCDFNQAFNHLIWDRSRTTIKSQYILNSTEKISKTCYLH